MLPDCLRNAAAPCKSIEWLQVKQRLQAAFKRFPRLADLPANSTVWLTFSNGHYSELMLNSLATIAALGMPALVYCFDEEAAALCEEYGLPYFAPPPSRMFNSTDFRQDRALFLQMGVHKPEMVMQLFRGEHALALRPLNLVCMMMR